MPARHKCVTALSEQRHGAMSEGQEHKSDRVLKIMRIKPVLMLMANRPIADFQVPCIPGWYPISNGATFQKKKKGLHRWPGKRLKELPTNHLQ